jgi:hypothetical protein
MNSYLAELIRKYRKKGILLDTNILLLYLVGTFDQRIVSTFSRTSNFSENDFIILLKLLALFEAKFTTPHILTEVSNLFGNRHDLHYSLQAYFMIVQELYITGARLGQNENFVEFGMTDTAILDLYENSYLVVTDDRRFYGLLLNNGVDTINFEDIRIGLA